MTALSEKPRIPIPADLKKDDALVLRNGLVCPFEHYDGSENYPVKAYYWFAMDGHAAALGVGEHVVAIERKAKPKKANPKKARPDKDAAWLLRVWDVGQTKSADSYTRRIHAIAKRLNGGVAP